MSHEEEHIPRYFRQQWDNFQSRNYFRECQEFERLTKMEVIKNRPPFICAGNLEFDLAGRVLSLGLAPHSRGESIPKTLLEYFEFRQNYFDQEEIPHRLHSYIYQFLQGAMGCMEMDNPNATWLHHHGYLTFDLVPYYIQKWKAPKWQPELHGLIIRHINNCLEMFDYGRIDLAIFTGRAWESILVEKVFELFPFEHSGPLMLSNITGRENHQKVRIYVGSINLSGHRFTAIVLSHLIHQIWALSYQHAFDLGREIRQILSGES